MKVLTAITAVTACLLMTACGDAETEEQPAAGADAALGPSAVTCGEQLCTDSVEIPEFEVLFPPCCDEDSGGICGAQLEDGCEGIDQPGLLDESCPETISALGTVLPGCCRDDGSCGVMSNVGFGCVERSDLNESAGGPLASMSCTP